MSSYLHNDNLVSVFRPQYVDTCTDEYLSKCTCDSILQPTADKRKSISHCRIHEFMNSWIHSNRIHAVFPSEKYLKYLTEVSIYLFIYMTILKMDWDNTKAVQSEIQNNTACSI